jgi:hypothetical protein
MAAGMVVTGTMDILIIVGDMVILITEVTMVDITEVGDILIGVT